MTTKDNSIPSTPHHAHKKPSFDQATDPYQHELFVHCYRLLGSVEDAEDALQETLLRAWRHLDSLKDRSVLRAWLYKIATNVSLDMVNRGKARYLPSQLYPAADPYAPLPDVLAEPLWLQPLPDSYLHTYIADPEQRYEIQEDISLAFLTVLQHLPGRQRAVLILCDVLEWKAQEVAEMLNVTVATVTSALQRARANLRKYQGEPISPPSRTAADVTRLLDRYVQAWETADTTSLVSLLREDGTLTMPPFPTWLRGRAAIQAFLERYVFADFVARPFRLIPTRANGSPAFGVYQRIEPNRFELVALQVVVLTEDATHIAQIDDFLALNQPLFAKFQLPRP